MFDSGEEHHIPDEKKINWNQTRTRMHVRAHPRTHTYTLYKHICSYCQSKTYNKWVVSKLAVSSFSFLFNVSNRVESTTYEICAFFHRLHILYSSPSVNANKPITYTSKRSSPVSIRSWRVWIYWHQLLMIRTRNYKLSIDFSGTKINVSHRLKSE